MHNISHWFSRFLTHTCILSWKCFLAKSCRNVTWFVLLLKKMSLDSLAKHSAGVIDHIFKFVLTEKCTYLNKCHNLRCKRYHWYVYSFSLILVFFCKPYYPCPNISILCYASSPSSYSSSPSYFSSGFTFLFACTCWSARTHI